MTERARREPVRIREAVPGEELEVARVHIASWQGAYRGLFPDAFLDGLDPLERARRHTFGLADPRTWVAELDGAIAGFATAGRSRDEDAPAAGELWALYVEPRHWAGGLGAALHERAVSELRRAGRAEAILWVLDGNQGAIAFYERHGWRADGASRHEGPWGILALVHRYRLRL